MAALIIIILGAIGIKTGVLTMNVFSLIITALGIIIPTLFFFFMYRSKKNNTG